MLAVLFLIAPSAFADPCWCAFESPPGFHNHQLPGILLNGTRFSKSPFGMHMFRPDVGEEVAYNCPEFLNPFLHLIASKFSVDGSALSTSYCSGGLICDTPDLVDGAHSVLYQCNLSDGQSSTKGLSLTVDDTAPSVLISTPSAGAVLRSGAIVISGEVSDASGIGPERVTAYWAVASDSAPALSVIGAGGPGPADVFGLGQPTRTWALSGEFESGTYHVLLWAHATDHLGNGSSVAEMQGSAVAFIIDGEGPRLALTSHQTGVSHLTTISGTAEDKSALREVRLEIRHNLTGKYWNGNSFAISGSSPPFVLASGVSGSSSAWYYSGLSAPFLVVDSSYTIAAQAMDSVGNFSAVEYSTFTYGIVPRVTIRALKGKLNLPAVTQAAGSFEVSYGDTVELCATVDPPEFEGQVGFRSKGSAFLPPTWGKTSRCGGLTVVVRSTTTVCKSAEVIEAVVGDQPTLNGKAQGAIVLPKSEFAHLKEENKGVECSTDPRLGDCKIADIYTVAVEAGSQAETSKLRLEGVLLTEHLERKQRLSCLSPCPFRSPDEKSGGLGFEPLFNLYAGNDILGAPILPKIKCAHSRVQHIFVGACFVGTATHSVLGIPLIEAKILKDTWKTDRTDCQNCLPLETGCGN